MAFRNGKVYKNPLIAWLKENPISKNGEGSTKADLEVRRLLGLCEGIEQKNAERAGKFLLRSEVEGWITRTTEKVKGVLNQKLKRELPPRLEGLKAAKIAAKMDEVVQEVVEAMRGAV